MAVDLTECRSEICILKHLIKYQQSYEAGTVLERERARMEIERGGGREGRERELGWR